GMNNSERPEPLCLRRSLLRKISSRSISSYVFASAGLVHPCQMRAIIVGYDGRTRPQPARRGEGAPCSASNFEYEEKKRRRGRGRGRKRDTITCPLFGSRHRRKLPGQ